MTRRGIGDKTGREPHIHATTEQTNSQLTDEEYIAFWDAFDRVIAQLRRERNIRYGRACQPLRRPKARRHTRR